MFYNIPTTAKSYVICHISCQTEGACIATSKCINWPQHNVTPTRHESHVAGQNILSRDKSVDLTGVLSCRATLFDSLRHNLLSLRQVSSM